MRYRTARKLPDDEFRRLTGVKRTTFELMLKVLRKAEWEKQLRRSGKRGKSRGVQGGRT
jgi:hypothetical protein